MESLITENTISSIMDKLLELESEDKEITVHMSNLYNMFDGEDNLIDSAKQIVEETIKRTQGINKMAEITIIKAIHNAMLIGFLAERYTRDIMMEQNNQTDLVFKHEYDTIETFLRKKAKQDINGPGKLTLHQLAEQAGENAKF